MSGIGHFAAGLVGKPAAQKVPLGVLLIASEANDLLCVLFNSMGIEPPANFSIDFTQGIHYLTRGSNPWSHGLFMSMVWSALAAGLGLTFYRSRRTAGVIGLVVFSHWILDFLMHSNLPLLFDGSPLVGVGLENSGAGFIFMTVLDLALLAGGITIYLKARKEAAKIPVHS